MTSPAEFNYEMGYTLPEFVKVLNSGFTNEPSLYRCQPLLSNNGSNNTSDSWLVTHHSSPIQVIIQLTVLPPRVLGAIALPVLKVKFIIRDDFDDQAEHFFDKFFKYFHKGGG